MAAEWKWVPVEPTPKMIRAAGRAMSPTNKPADWVSAGQKHRWRWLAMVEAAPTELPTDQLRTLGAPVFETPAPSAIPDLVARIARLWAELHEADNGMDGWQMARRLRPDLVDEPTNPLLERDAALVGRQGQTMTVLRPAGRARIGDEYLDVVSEGVFIPPGRTIEVIEVVGNRIVVRERT